LSPDELKDKVLDWIAEIDYDILQVTKNEKTNFILTMKAKDTSVLNFPIRVISPKKPEGLVLGFTGWIRGEDNKSFRGTDINYIEKMYQELWDRANLSNLEFSSESRKEETRLRTTKGFYVHEITKENFLMTISELTEFRKYMHSTFKKYKLTKPKEDFYGI
jgi:hypothetical protein